MVTGIALTGMGGLFALYGASMLAIGSSCDGGDCGAASDAAETSGTVYLVVGGVMMAVGIPLTIHGSARVPAYGSARVPATAGRAPTPGEARLLVGANSVHLQMTW